MVKAIEILNDATEESLFNDDSEGDDLMKELDSIELANIHVVRCAAHTLHLCVFAEKINSCRTLRKSLRTGAYR